MSKKGSGEIVQCDQAATDVDGGVAFEMRSTSLVQDEDYWAAARLETHCSFRSDGISADAVVDSFDYEMVDRKTSTRMDSRCHRFSRVQDNLDVGRIVSNTCCIVLSSDHVVAGNAIEGR